MYKLNYAGEILQDDFTANGSDWKTQYTLDPQGRISDAILPSGLNDLTDYNAQGLVLDNAVQNGSDTSSKAVQSKFAYGTQTGNLGVASITETYVSSVTMYPNADGSQPRLTTYSPVFGDSQNSLRVTQLTETLPPVADEGTGANAGNDTIVTNYNSPYGQASDVTVNDSVAGSFKTSSKYDPGTGAVTNTDQQVGGGAPDIVTSATVDDLGRPRTTTNGNGKTTGYQYADSFGDSKTTVTPPAGPQVVTDDNALLGYIQTQTLAFHAQGAVNVPDGTVMSQSRNFIDLGGFTYETDVWSNYGSSSAPVYKTYNSFDNTQHWSQTINANLTVTKTLDDALGRQTSVQQGVASAGSNGGAPTPGTLTTIEQDVYDGGNAGDGNLTLVSKIVGSMTNNPNQVTQRAFNWRDELVATQQGIGATIGGPYPLTYNVLNNLGEAVEVDVFDGTGITIAPTLNAPPAGAAAMRAKSTFVYDDRGRDFQTTVWSVDPSQGLQSGAASMMTISSMDGRGNAVATTSPTGQVTTAAFDGAERQTSTAVLTPSGTTVSSVATTWNADGDPTLVTTNQANPDGSMRTSYSRDYYDAADRTTASANFGTSAALANQYTSAPPARSAAGPLVTSGTYDAGGFQRTTIDAAGIVTTYTNDSLGRHIIVLQTKPGALDLATVNSAYTFDGLNHVTLATVKNIVPGQAKPQYQVTKYVYATSVNTIPASLTNDNLVQVQLPGYDSNASSTANAPYQETFNHDNLGDVTSESDRNGFLHTFVLDAMGRTLEDDAYYKIVASNPTPPVDPTVSARAFTLDTLGQTVLASTYGPDTATGGSDVGRLHPVTGTAAAATPISQVENVYSGFGQLKGQYQSHSGAVDTGSTPEVQYNSSTSNPSQLQSLQYPDGRQLYYGYSPISQVTSVSDSANLSSPALETYGYLGLGPIVQRTLPISQSSGPGGTTTTQITEATSLDSFGRVSGINWGLSTTAGNGTPGSPTVLDQFAYGYDADSNPTYSNNLTPGGANFSEQLTYDSLERQNRYYRGQLSGTTIASPTLSSTWQLDSQGNRYGGTGSPYPAAYNPLNESASNNYNPDGTANYVSFGAGDYASMTFDAWGSLKSASNATTTDTETYDALGRLISENGIVNGATTLTHYFYDGTNVVEERDGSGKVTAQYVWAPDGTLVLRDRSNPAVNGGNPDSRIPNVGGTTLNERIYALTDAFGSTTAIAGIDGTVLERYVNDANGKPQALDPSFSPYLPIALTRDGVDADASLYGWTYLWHGARYHPLFSHWIAGGRTTVVHNGGGVYDYGGGTTGWHSSYDGGPLQPDTAAEIAAGNAYNPVPLGLQATIYGLQAGIVGAGIAAGFATGGVASIGLGYFGVGVAASSAIGAAALTGEGIALSAGGTVTAGVLGGGLAGFGIGGAQGLASTGTLGGTWTGAWHGGLAGAAGGLVGASAGLGAGALGLTCGNLGATGASVLRGALEGGTGGFTAGFTQGGLDTGTLQGAWQEGLTGAWTGAAIGGGIGAILTNACFDAGTPLFLAERVKLPDGKTVAVPAGSQMVERLKQGDLLLSGSEFDPTAPLEAKEVEDVFVRAGRILVIHVGGREIRTTAEHEFFVRDRGKIPAGDLMPGDLFRGYNGAWTPVTKTVLTGEVVPVYNVRVADFHTYFVGCPEWGFSVWAHNAYIGSTEASHDMGVQLGRRYLTEESGLNLSATNWVNPFEYRGKYGQGFDDVLQDPDGDLWIVEYKGGGSTLGSDQMTENWVRSRIQRIIDEAPNNPWGGRLLDALDSGNLRGITVSTPSPLQPTATVKLRAYNVGM